MSTRLVIDGKGNEKPVVESATIDYPDKKIIPSSPELWLENMIDQQRIRKSFEHSQNEASVTIETGLAYVAILFTGDWHFGSEKTDYVLWDKHMTLVRQTPGVYMCIIGDERDNFVTPKYRSGLFEGLLNPQNQADFIIWYLRQLDEKRKIIARVGGNHDHWTWEASGINLETFWYREMSAPLLRNGGFVHMMLNSQPYDLYLHHGVTRFNSSFNPSHRIKRAREFMGSFDCGVMGHSHVTEIAHSFTGLDSKEYDFVQVSVGTYKRDDQYARSKNLGRGQLPGTTVLFNTSKRKMMPFVDLEIALEVMKALNGG